MITQFLIKKFVSNPDQVTDSKTRTAYGKLASFVGIFCNVFLFAGKLAAGLISGSIAITADAINNLSDASSNIITLLGFWLGAKAPDKKHPYGYARYEYLAGLSVSVMIVAIGLMIGKDSILKIIEPEQTEFSWLTVIILAASILVKIWMSFFNRHVGNVIDSDTLRAAAADSRNDVLSTGAVLLSTFLCLWTGIALIDGIMGLLVAAFIIYSGVGLVKDTLSPLLGENPDPELITHIEEKVMSYKGVLGMHDLLVHDYGPGHRFASLHVEMPVEMNPMDSHDIIDNIEADFYKNDNLLVSIHYDPIVTADDSIKALRSQINAVIAEIDAELTIHDLRIVSGETHTNVLFDLVFPPGFKKDRDDVVEEVSAKVRELDEKFIPKIKCEQNFSIRT